MVIYRLLSSAASLLTRVQFRKRAAEQQKYLREGDILQKKSLARLAQYRRNGF